MRTTRHTDRGLTLAAGLAIGLYLVFLVLPLLLSLRSSLTNENPLRGTSDFIGLRNYTELAGDERLRASVTFTLVLAAGVTVAANALGVGFALLLNRTSLSYRVMRTLAFLPQVLSGVIVAFVWQTVLTQNGLLNNVLVRVGLLDEPFPWLGSPNAALISIGVVVTWVLSGFTTVVYLAALQNIPLELHDMASIDGVRGTQRFRKVTWPMIAPGTTISVTISLITVLKLYDIIAVLTGGGPAESTQSTALYIVKLAFTSDRVGYASAAAMILLALSALIALTVTGFLRRREVTL
ncbi:sugar ABC transporter permease [Actinoplanes sp. NPDC051861]|uniref:carbohydrate ABC transporter permease n=1 Tax=Actinoplanes sp. NPDC051861 TaxID=3155170 RepID=UPI003423C882